MRAEMHPLIVAAMARRSAAGLTLTFSIPGREDLFTCHAKDEAQKATWIKQAATHGWKRVDR